MDGFELAYRKGQPAPVLIGGPARLSSSVIEFASDYIGILVILLKSNTEFVQRLRHGFFAALTSKARFAAVVFLIHGWTLCGASPGVCNRSWMILMPIESLNIKGLRYTMFQYFWHYMCIAHLHDALLQGLPRTFEYASRLAELDEKSKRSIWARNGRYLSHFMDLGIFWVLQPLMFLWVTRDVGMRGWIQFPESEASVYVGLSLHLMRIFFEALERLAARNGWHQVHITIFVITVLTIASWTDNDSMNISSVLFQESLDMAELFVRANMMKGGTKNPHKTSQGRGFQMSDPMVNELLGDE